MRCFSRQGLERIATTNPASNILSSDSGIVRHSNRACICRRVVRLPSLPYRTGLLLACLVIQIIAAAASSYVAYRFVNLQCIVIDFCSTLDMRLERKDVAS